MGLSGEEPLGEVKTEPPNSDYHKNASSVAAPQAEVARGYLKRAAWIYELNDHPSGANGPMVTGIKKFSGGRVLVFEMSAFAEMPGDVGRICDITAHKLKRTNLLQRRSQAHQGHVQAAHLKGLGDHGAPRLGPSPPRPRPGPHHPRPGAPQRSASKRRMQGKLIGLNVRPRPFGCARFE